jgi:hypothetical protein
MHRALAAPQAANVSQQLRRLDGKSAIKTVPEKVKRFLGRNRCREFMNANL